MKILQLEGSSLALFAKVPKVSEESKALLWPFISITPAHLVALVELVRFSRSSLYSFSVAPVKAV